MTTKQKLIDAFERIKAGKPIRIDTKRKISPASVEDEAGLGRSLLRNNEDYQDLFDEIVLAKKNQARTSKTTKGGKPTSIDPTVRELKEALAKIKTSYKELELKYNNLLICNVELTQVIVEKRFQEHLGTISSDAVNNVVNIYKE
jgi:hypothetical protein